MKVLQNLYGLLFWLGTKVYGRGILNYISIIALFVLVFVLLQLFIVLLFINKLRLLNGLINKSIAELLLPNKMTRLYRHYSTSQGPDG